MVEDSSDADEESMPGLAQRVFNTDDSSDDEDSMPGLKQRFSTTRTTPRMTKAACQNYSRRELTMMPVWTRRKRKMTCQGWKIRKHTCELKHPKMTTYRTWSTTPLTMMKTKVWSYKEIGFSKTCSWRKSRRPKRTLHPRLYGGNASNDDGEHSTNLEMGCST